MSGLKKKFQIYLKFLKGKDLYRQNIFMLCFHKNLYLLQVKGEGRAA